MIALTRRPTADIARCELTHLAREPVDLEKALSQHATYRAVLSELGFEVIEIPAAPGLPDAVFVEDPAVVLDEVAVITRPGAESRRAECASVAAALAGHRECLVMEAPCTLDGGDVFDAEGIVYVGRTPRTNHAGLKWLAHALLPNGYRVKAIEVRDVLHLKTACTYLGRGTLLADRRFVDLSRVSGLRVLDVPEAETLAANTMAVDGTVLIPEGAPRTAELLSAEGFEVRELAISEFQKAEGGLSCLSLRIT